MSAPLVIFDCDGVLVDSEVISAAVLIELAGEAGVAFDAAYVRAHFLGRSFPTVARTIAERFGTALPPGFEAAYRARLLRRFEAELRVTEGLWEALGRLRARACVATSSSPERVARSLAIAGLAGRFERVFTASEVARGKPAPDLFLHAAAAMGARPADCLVVEDSGPGIAAARAAGMTVALFAGGSHMRARGGRDDGAGGRTGSGGTDPPSAEFDRDGSGTFDVSSGPGFDPGFDSGPPLRAFGDWASLADHHPTLFAPAPDLLAADPTTLDPPDPGPRA